MTKNQITLMNNLTSFANNIGKLSVGRSTRLTQTDEFGDTKVLAKVTCDTVGEYPRKFSVSSTYGLLPAGKGYTYKRIMSNLFANFSAF